MDIRENKEAHQAYVLEKINAALRELGSTAKWKRAPEFQAEYESLKGKSVVMVDDVKDVFETLLPELIVATDGKADYVHYTGQDLDSLVQTVLDRNPDLVLMDYNLSERLKGSEVIKSLKAKGFNGQAVGFSSEREANRSFTEAGAIGSVNKMAGMPDETVKELGKLIK